MLVYVPFLPVDVEVICRSIVDSKCYHLARQETVTLNDPDAYSAFSADESGYVDSNVPHTGSRY